jgi:long-chain acyl-CoA synthetase
MDEDGFFYLAGRRNDQVKIRGLKVMPGEIAQTLSRRFPNCQIAVVPFELRNTTRLALFLAADNGPPASSRQIRRVCSETLSRHEMPSHVEIVDRLPRMASMKVDFRSLSDRAARHVKLPFVRTTTGTVGTAEAMEKRA